MSQNNKIQHQGDEMNDPAADLWVIFFLGDRSLIAAQRCPKCGGKLKWSPCIYDTPHMHRGEREYPMGLSIYCVGTCNYMIGLLDGRAPAWALEVKDWDAFHGELEAMQ